MAIAIGAGIAAGGSLIGGAMSSSAAGSAADAQSRSAQSQIDLQKYEFDQTQKQEKPWLDAGTNALSILQKGFGKGGQYTNQLDQIANAKFTPGDFTKSPEYDGYQFQQKQGQDAISRGAAARGMNLSPATLQALSQYNQGLASTSYQGWYDQAYNQWQNQQSAKTTALGAEIGGQETLAGYGNQANALTAQSRQLSTDNQINSIGSQGNARAAGITGTAAGINSAIGGVSGAASNYMQNQYYASMFNPGSSNPAAWDTENPSNFQDF